MPTNSKDKEYKYFMLVCLLIKGTIVSLEITSTQQRRVKYSIYMVLIKPFSLTRNLHSLSTYTKKKNVSLAHVPTRYSSCIRRPLKKKKAQGHTRIARSAKTKGFYQPPFLKCLSSLVGVFRPARRAMRCFDIQSRDKSMITQVVSDRRLLIQRQFFFLHQ